MALADLTSNGGILQPAQAMKFLRIMIDESVVMKEATVVPMKSHKQQIDKIRFGTRILRNGTEGAPLPEADRSKPDLSQVELDAQLLKAEVRLNNEVLEDSIERGQLKQTIMTLMAERIALDAEELVINGDTASTDPFLATFDGLIKQITSNVVPLSPTASISKSVFRDMLKAMPSAFLRMKRKMRFYTSTDAELDWRDSLSDRATVLGDSQITQDTTVPYGGVPVMDVPVFPETLGSGTNETVVLLTDPKNINVGVWRQIRFETDKDISSGVVIIVATMRMDTKFSEETATVKATGVKVSG